MKRFLIIAIVLLAAGCAPQRKISMIAVQDIRAGLLPAEESHVPELNDFVKDSTEPLAVIGDDGKEVLIMKAIREENGEMVATDQLSAAKVVSRFRNVAERNGKVDLMFDVIVPASLQDSRWQLRFYPELHIMGDTTRLESVVITGKAYRKAQLRGYEQYEKFLSSIISDSSRFLYLHQLEVFLSRNLPEIYRFRDDTSHVTDEVFYSHYGVTEKMAVEHYTRNILLKRNRRKIEEKDRMFRKYVKAPIHSEGLRLDTVISGPGDDILYRYRQTVATRPGLKKASVYLPGEIYDMEKLIYRIPSADSLTFYISSVSSLVDSSPKYMTRVISRRVEENTYCYIEFESGRHEIRPCLGENPESISMIRKGIGELLSNDDFVMDSITVNAWCSPEGERLYNENLSRKRAESVCEYFSRYAAAFMDSLRKDRGMSISLDRSYRERETEELKFISKSNGENWKMLNDMVKRDSIMTADDKDSFYRICATEDPDEREHRLSRENYYKYLRERVYPMLRTVRFDFHLHRKGMVKDTVHTTELDTAYMQGVNAIKERDYRKAVSILRPYKDLNTAVAYCSLDYNASALEVLAGLPETDKVLYMKAILYCRTGNEALAAECYIKACAINRSFISRGNLDPEISSLIKKYGLNDF